MAKKRMFSHEMGNIMEYVLNVLLKEYPIKAFTSEYIIVAMLDNKKCRANILLDNYLMSNDMEELRSIYVSHIEELSKSQNDVNTNTENGILCTDTVTRIFELSEKEARRFHRDNVGSEHVLLAMLNPENKFNVMDVFNSAGIRYQTILEKCEMDNRDKKRNNTVQMINNKPNIKANMMQIDGKQTPLHEFIEKYTINITNIVKQGDYERLIGREREVGNIIKIFSRKRKNNVILVGESGVGKSKIVYGVAERIINGDVPELLANKEIVMLDIMTLVSGTNFRGMLEERVNTLIKELKKNKKYILFLDDIHTMLRSGTKEKDTDISGMIMPVLNDGAVQIIATTNNKDYRNTVEINNAISRKFQKVVIEPNDDKETFDILIGSKHSFEDYHGVVFPENVIKKIVKLSKRYITESCLPDSAFDVMDSVGAYVSSKRDKNIAITDLNRRLDEINEEKINALNVGEFERIEEINKREEEIEVQLNDLKNHIKSEKIFVDEDDVSYVISEMTSVPVSKLDMNEKKNIANIDNIIKDVIVGQDEAITDVCKSIKRNRVGLGYSSSNSGVYMLLGGSGVGKTLFAKMLAKLIYGDEKALIRIDMSEYSEKSSISKLIGSAPGYVGFENGGQLTEMVKNKPYSVILLDEIEKADEEIYNLFLQLFDEGRLTDSSGKLINFKNCIIIMTSNIGVKSALEIGDGIGFETNGSVNKKNIIEKELKKRFSPEFLNRIDKIVFFNQLTDENLEKIVRLEMNKFKSRLNELKYDIVFDESVVKFIHNLSLEQKEYGARPIVRLIQENIEDGVTEKLLENDYADGYTFSASCVNNSVNIC